MALSTAQKADVRLRLGWSARFHQFDSRLEQAMSALATEADHETQVIALLASCLDIDTKLLAQHTRLKAAQYGTVKLNPYEQKQLRSEGARFVNRIASILGVEVRNDIYSDKKVTTFGGFGGPSGGGNYIGK